MHFYNNFIEKLDNCQKNIVGLLRFYILRSSAECKSVTKHSWKVLEKWGCVKKSFF